MGKEREKQLFEQYCRGRTMAQFRNSEESAWNIVHLAEEKTPVLFSHIYRELAGLQSDISDTKPNTGPRTWFTQLFGRANVCHFRDPIRAKLLTHLRANEFRKTSLVIVPAGARQEVLGLIPVCALVPYSVKHSSLNHVNDCSMLVLAPVV